MAIGELQRARELTGIDFTMVLLAKLPDEAELEDYAAKLYSHWRIGRDTEEKGVLFLFAESEGELKIEVSYALEELYPDGFVGSFQDSLKHYYAGRYFGDFLSGMITAMLRRARQDDMQSILAEFSDRLPLPDSPTRRSYSGGAGVAESGFFYEKDRKLGLIRALEETTRENFGAHADPRETIRRYVEYLGKGYNDPFIDLITEGSQYMAMEYPKSAGFQKGAARDFAGDYELTFQDDLAVAQFKGAPVMPLLLRRYPDGLWRIDVTKSWAYCQFTNDLEKTKPAFADHPWMFAWPEELRHPEFPATPKLLPGEVKIGDEIKALEAQIQSGGATAQTYFKLAEILYFECYWIRGAMDALEKGLELEPSNILQRKRLIAFSYRFPDLSRVAHHYEAILKYDPNDGDALRTYIWYLEQHRSEPGKVAALKKRQENLSYPATPFYLNCPPATRVKKTFAIPPETHAIEIEVTHFKHLWHPRTHPSIRIVLRDAGENGAFGVDLRIEEEGGDDLALLVDTDDDQAGLVPLSVPPIPRGETRHLVLRWKDDRTARIEFEGREVARGRLSYDPVKLTTSTRSGGATFVIRD